MLRRVLLVMAGISFGVSVLNAQMMQIPPVRNAPFEAVNSLTVTDSRGTHHAAGKVARDRSGSTYQESWKRDSNELIQIFIIDVPGKRTIRLDPVKKLYIIQDMPALEPIDLSADDVAKQIDQALSAKPTHDETGATIHDVKPLGKKDIDGVVTLGVATATVRKASPGTAALDITNETWTSPKLRIALQSKTHDTITGSEYVNTLSNLRQTPPNPSLFLIPIDYEQDPSNVRVAPAPPAAKTAPTTPQ